MHTDACWFSVTAWISIASGLVAARPSSDCQLRHSCRGMRTSLRSAAVAFVLCCIATLAGAARPPVILIPGSVRNRPCAAALVWSRRMLDIMRLAPRATVLCTASLRIPLAGLAGSVLETRLRNASSAFAWCPQNQDWTVTWVTLVAAARPDCLLSNLAIYYDEATETCACWVCPVLHTTCLLMQSYAASNAVQAQQQQ